MGWSVLNTIHDLYSNPDWISQVYAYQIFTLKMDPINARNYL